MIVEKPAAVCPIGQWKAESGKVLTFLQQKIKLLYGDKTPLRIFHAKTIGLVEATLTVDNALDASLKIGLFTRPATYKVWIRFTNSSTRPSPDSKKAVRGMAIKILDVPGAENPEDTSHRGEQDIILSNSRTFSPGSGKYALSAVKLLLGSWTEKLSSGVRIGLRYLNGSVKFLTFNIVTPNVLEERYYSGTPYAFGEKRAIKWHVRPIRTIASVLPRHPGKNFLNQQLNADLKKQARQPVAFGLYVQFQLDKDSEPIDDSTIEWKTTFHRVGVLEVKKQGINTPERIKLDKQMSFSPAHSMAEHAPLGSINAIRVGVYGILAKARLSHSSESQF